MHTITLFDDVKETLLDTPSLFTDTGLLIEGFQLTVVSAEVVTMPKTIQKPKKEKSVVFASAASTSTSVSVKPKKAPKTAKKLSYHERGAMLEEAAAIQDEPVVFLQRYGRYCFLEAGNLLGATMLLLARQTPWEHYVTPLEVTSQSYLRRVDIVAVALHKENEKTSTHGPRLIFSLDSLIAPKLEDSNLWKFFSALGVTVIPSRSLKNWVNKQFKIRERQMTAFELPDTKDTRPLVERLEIGTVLKCKQHYAGTSCHAGYQYIVSKVPDVYENDEATPEIKSGTLVEIVDNGGYPRGSLNLLDNLDEYFETTGDSVTVYDPKDCIIQKYPELIAQATKKLEKLDLPLFDHVKHDVVQSALKNKVFNGKPMRMGKTSESLAWAMMRGSKKVAYIGPKNGRGVVQKEMERLGHGSECASINRFSDLEANKDTWLELHTYDWLKRAEDPFRKFGQKHWGMPLTAVCPKCLKKAGTVEAELKLPTMIRYIPKHLDNMGAWVKGHKVDTFGYRCPVKGCGYIDYDRARYYETRVNDHKSNKYYVKKAEAKGRWLEGANIAYSEWTPPRYKRLRKRYGTILIDEIHMAKDWNTLQTKAVFGMKAKNHYGMTGTLMPNNPTDPYWPLHWIFGGGNHQFKFNMWEGASDFAAAFTQNVTVQNQATGTSYVKRIPYLKDHQLFWQLMKDKMIRRSYDDPLVKASFANAGLIIPTVERKVIQVEPDTEQAVFLMASMADFEKSFNQYMEELKEKTAKAKAKSAADDFKTYVLNSSYVLGQMLRMRIAATCPGHLNDKLKNDVYKGAPGGAKMTEVHNLVSQKVAEDGKILILSDFRYNQKLLEKELSAFKPIRFQTEWSEDKRNKAIEQFQEDPDYKVFIAGPRAIGLAVDLSAARTCICTDLLWTPGTQQQAWSRILKPVPEERTCEVFIMSTKFSIDQHVYDTFYSKLAAAEQAFDRRVLSKKDTVVDIKAFVDLILNDKGAMLQWLVDAGEDALCYVPVLDMLVPLEEREV
jgi:hypothetical protein